MEDTTKRKRVRLINELIQGKELAKQLSNHMILSSHETNEFLIDKIISTYQKALTMLNVGGETKPINDEHEFKHKALIKKRKSMPGWKEQVKICTNTGLFKGSLDDEYCWRKYGQKHILGTKFPRGYYRCKQRNGQGCLATKHIQRSDEDPTIIEVTYRGRHTCSQSKPSKLEKKKLHNDQKNQLQTQEEASFTLKEELEKTKENIFHWFCFPSLSIGSENETLMESFSDAFVSPETSESNFFGLSEYHFGYNAQTSESDMNETVSATTSDTNPPILGLDMLLHRGDFDTDFPYVTPE